MRDWLKSSPNVAPLLPGHVQVHDLLHASGGQGVVHRGSVDGTPAAIKVYLPGQIEQRIQREVAALRELECPSIVKLLWNGTVEAQGEQLQVVATKLVVGEPLDRVLASRPRSGSELGVLAYDVALAIKAMWSRLVVHRDLKPSNILLRPDGRACVIDLGVARHLDETSLTQTGWTCGTYGYMSPEQARFSKALSCHSDLFALGVVLVVAAVGHHPTGGNQSPLVNLHENLPPRAASWAHADLLKRLLAPRANSRPRPAEVLAVLSSFAPSTTGVPA